MKRWLPAMVPCSAPVRETVTIIDIDGESFTIPVCGADVACDTDGQWWLLCESLETDPQQIRTFGFPFETLHRTFVMEDPLL